MIVILKYLKNKLSNWLHSSSRAHIRERNVNGLADLVDLIDRFIDEKMKYDLEWDDFISWQHENYFIEEVRGNLGCSENLLFSDSSLDRKKYILILLEERNRVAALAGLAPRGKIGIDLLR